MKKIVSCERMKELDQYTIAHQGVPSLVLMERAALSVVDEIKKYQKHLEKILVLCGSGNNGGDGFAVARLLFLEGYDTEILFLGKEEHMTRETKVQKQIADHYLVPYVNNLVCEEYTTIVDAVFGVGLSREVTGTYAEIIKDVNASSAFVASVDIPSGIHGTDGRIMGIAIKADLTVTFAFEKAGQLLYPGKEYAGKLVLSDMGIYEDEKEDLWYRLESKDLSFLADRKEDGNKGSFGKVLSVCGSKGMSGAAFLCAKAALLSGAGMVKIQTAEENREILQILLPEAMTAEEEFFSAYEKNMRWCDILVMGPGMGISEHSKEKAEWFLKEAYKTKKPMVLDADALNLLSKNPDWYTYLHEKTILTPHMGEFARLTGKTIQEIKENRLDLVRAYASAHGVVVVLKDACSLTAMPDGTLYFNTSGNAGMATAGSGDVLAGILAGLLASEHLKPWNSMLPAAGVYLHGLAGDAACEVYGKRALTAGAMIEYIKQVLKNIEDNGYGYEETF